MPGRILILGAAGRLGRAAAQAFRDGGWTVVSLVRPGAGSRAASGTIVVEDDALHREAVLEAAPGADVILHAVNLPFTQWAKHAVTSAEIAIAAAEAAGATLIFPGNLYNYGKPLPARIGEATPMHPTSRKGALRVAIERRLEQASERGVRAIVLRAGEFYGGGSRGSWFDLVIARDVALNVVRYPGPLDVAHAWAYLPDLAKAMVAVAERREKFGPFETFGFAGHSVTGSEMLAAIARAVDRPLKRRVFPWWALMALGPFVAHWRELAEIAYLWRSPHEIDGGKLRGAIGELPETPFERAVAAALDPLSR